MNELEMLRKKKLDELRTIAEREGIEVAVRWNRKTLARKILEHRKLKELDDYLEPNNSPAEPSQEPKRSPEFEALAGGGPDPAPPPAENIKDEGRGGFREGAGRPKGMTDDEARIRRLLDLEVPDLLVMKIVHAVCFVYGVKSNSPLEKDEVKSVALGATRELYFWFPKLQGRTSKLTLHTQALEDISSPFVSRGISNLFSGVTVEDAPVTIEPEPDEVDETKVA